MSENPEVPDPKDSAQMFRLIYGYWISQMIYVAAKLKIADQLEKGPMSCSRLAEASNVAERPLYRLLRGLASRGIFTECRPRHFALTPLASCLRTNVPGSMRDLALLYNQEVYSAWKELLHSVKSGETAFQHVFGKGLFEYLRENPESEELFNRAMTNRAGEIATAVAEAYDFSSMKRIVDLGGGQGSLLVAILRAYPGTEGVLFDEPSVVEDAKKFMQEAGLAERCHFVAGDFFQEVPAGGDVYLLSRILHDWDDEAARNVLESCRRAGASPVLVIEELIRPGDDPCFSKLIDLQMLVLTGGAERSREEFQQVFASAGYRLERVIPTQCGMFIVQGVLV